MIHLYIYFKQENAKKIYIFFLLLFFAVCFAQNTVTGNLPRRNALPEVTCIFKKQYPRMFLGTILKRLPSGNAKYCPALVFNLLIR
jgi:hypothetical protein